MRSPLRFLVLIAWGVRLVFLGRQVGVWVRDALRVAILTFAALLACGADGVTF
jgi:hypothetical protein